MSFIGMATGHGKNAAKYRSKNDDVDADQLFDGHNFSGMRYTHPVNHRIYTATFCCQLSVFCSSF